MHQAWGLVERKDLFGGGGGVSGILALTSEMEFVLLTLPRWNAEGVSS